LALKQATNGALTPAKYFELSSHCICQYKV